MILRVMIVEDEDMIRNGLVKTLPWVDMGCTVIGSAGDGKSGLEQIIERRPDVVITDIRMPEMDGFEMLERALAVYRFHIIIFTSYAEFDYAQKAPRAAASMPRVGSSRMTTFGFVDSARAMTTFCWLPPERLPI